MPSQAKTQLNQLCIDALRRHPVLGKVGLSHLRRLCAVATRQTVAGGKTIFAKGDPGKVLFVIGAGTVKIEVPSDGADGTAFNLLSAGEVFGDFALFGGEPRSVTAVAVEDCELAVIKRSDFQTFMRGEPKLTTKLIDLLGRELRLADMHYQEAFD